MDFISALAGDGKRCAELPFLGNLQRCGVVDVVGSVALGIEQHLIPTDDRELRGRGRTGRESAFKRGRREKVKISLHRGDSLRDVDVDSEAVESISPPLQRLAIGLEEQSGEINDWAVWGMLTGNPRGVVKSQVTGSSRDLQRRVEDFTWGVGGINRNCD